MTDTPPDQPPSVDRGGAPSTGPVIRLASAPWHPALASLIAWSDAHPLADDDPERDSLDRLLFQIDGRIRYLERRANPETPSAKP